MPTNLTPEMMKRVAREVDKDYQFGYENASIFANDWVALVRTVAQLIDERLKKAVPVLADTKGLEILFRSNKAIATNNVPEIESLCAELIND